MELLRRPRLCVFRSNKNISVQIIDDVNGVTLAAASTLDKELKGQIEYGGNKEAAKEGWRSDCKESAGKGHRRTLLLTEADSSITEELRNLLTVLVKLD